MLAEHVSVEGCGCKPLCHSLCQCGCDEESLPWPILGVVLAIFVAVAFVARLIRGKRPVKAA